MNSALSSSFRSQFAALPPDVQELARKNYRLWKNDAFRPSLHYKRVGRRTESYSVRIGKRWRIVGTRSGDTMIWFWIGSHADYDRLVASL